MTYDPNDNQEYSPLTNPAPEGEIGDYGMETPGGNTTQIVWNEKGVLDSYVYACAQTPAGQSLPSSHDAHKMGIYGQNHAMPDYD